LGLNSVTGTLQWDVAVAIPKGLDEIERLSELVGGLVKVSDTAYCVRAYQSAIGCVDVDKSSLRWSRKLLGTDALAGNSEILVATDAVDRLNGWNSQTGQLLWSNESFVRRGLSAPAIWDDMVVVGDAEGTLHFLVSATGKTIFRESTGSSAIESAPLVFGKTLLVVNSKGDLLAFRANNK
jgi:outer membrane protein assembly factor BamB